MSSPVTESVANNDLCIGCGACAGICPRRRLYIDWSDTGCYVAREHTGPCVSGCTLCAQVCPFVGSNPNEDDVSSGLYAAVPGVERYPEAGYVTSSWVGWSQRGTQRLDGASGGLATWFLTQLLRSGAVDRVICVAPQPASIPMFNYAVCTTEDEVEIAARSAYYPVEMSEVLRTIQDVEGRYAMICLPCSAKALRLAANSIPSIRRRVVCVAGIVCGHSASAFFADYAAAIADPNAGPPSHVVFRTKNPRFPATELGIECLWHKKNGTHSETAYWSQGLGEAWSRQWFTPNPCLYCDDVFAETADIAFMDAWLPDYESDYRGTSLMIARSKLADSVIRSGAESGEIVARPCSMGDVTRSQAAVITNKREGLAHRLWAAQKRGVLVPSKRVKPRPAGSRAERRHWDTEAEAVAVGCRTWMSFREPVRFRRSMARYGWKRPQTPLVVRTVQSLRGTLRRLKRMVNSR